MFLKKKRKSTPTPLSYLFLISPYMGKYVWKNVLTIYHFLPRNEDQKAASLSENNLWLCELHCKLLSDATVGVDAEGIASWILPFVVLTTSSSATISSILSSKSWPISFTRPWVMSILAQDFFSGSLPLLYTTGSRYRQWLNWFPVTNDSNGIFGNGKVNLFWREYDIVATFMTNNTPTYRL